MYEIELLDNGLQILKIPLEQVESISTIAMVKTGSRYEKKSAWGVAHFLEHMVFKGTKKFPNTKTISERIDSIGAQFNAFTSEEMTAFYIRSAGKDLDTSVEMLGQLMTQALLEPAEIKKEKGVILEEMHMYEDQPAQDNMILFNQMFYQGSGLAHNILGTKATIKKMERQHFLDYIEDWYIPQNILMVIAGKKEVVMSRDLTKKITSSFIFPSSKKEKNKKQKDFWSSDFKYGPPLQVKKKEIEQTHFIMAWPGITHFDQRQEQLNLLLTILGGNMSSRLFLQVREKRGLCYYISAQKDVFADAGSLMAVAGVNTDKLIEALQATRHEFLTLSTGKNCISEAELQKAKNYLTGNLILAQESVHNLAISYGTKYLMTGKVLTIAERLKQIQKVTLNEIKALASDLLQPNLMRLSLIGNISLEQEQALALL